MAWSDPDFTRLMALDHQGNEVWTINLGSWISQHGFGCSPMLYDDLVVLNCSQEDSKLPGTAAAERDVHRGGRAKHGKDSLADRPED